MDEAMELRSRVRELRERLGLRQADLAKETGVTRQTIIAIEKGRLNPSIVLALRIARVLREPVDYVFYLERERDEEEGEHDAESSDRSEPPALFDFV